MTVPRLHAWPRRPAAAIALQKELSPLVQLVRYEAHPRLFCGIDVAFPGDGSFAIAGAVVWDAAASRCLETRLARKLNSFPYVPGLLSFRELPVMLAAIRALRIEPEVFLCDAQGYAHPRHMGLACHLGLWLHRPTVGCAKSRLCGEHGPVGAERGDESPLRLDGEVVGVALRTRAHVRPLYVSPGHLCDVESARRLTLAACTRYRLPEPTRLAHQLVTTARR